MPGRMGVRITKATLHGPEVRVTLRGTDCASGTTQVEETSQWLQSQRGPVADETRQCPLHHTPMQPYRGKDGGPG